MTRNRNYSREYEQYHGTEKQKKRRAQRNAARRKMTRLGRVKKGDKKDVHHKDRNTANNKRNNLTVVGRGSNRKVGESTGRPRRKS